jgi:hypothetical protein
VILFFSRKLFQGSVTEWLEWFIYSLFLEKLFFSDLLQNGWNGWEIPFSGETFFQRSVTEWLEWLRDSLFLEKIVPRICCKKVGGSFFSKESCLKDLLQKSWWILFSGETFFQRSVTEWLEWLRDSLFLEKIVPRICCKKGGGSFFLEKLFSKDLLQNGWNGWEILFFSRKLFQGSVAKR